MTYNQALRHVKEERSTNNWFQLFPITAASDIDTPRLREHFFANAIYFAGTSTMNAKTLTVGRILLKEMLDELIARKRISAKYRTEFTELLKL